MGKSVTLICDAAVLTLSSIGEAFGHDAWFQNVTNLDYSFQAIDAILKFIVASGVPYGYTIAPINEASDNFAGFATATGLT